MRFKNEIPKIIYTISYILFLSLSIATEDQPFIGYFKRNNDVKLLKGFSDAYIDIGFDENGQRHYVSLNEAISVSNEPPPSVDSHALQLHHEEVVGSNKKIFTSLFNYSTTCNYGFNIIDDLSFWTSENDASSRLLVLSDLSSLKKEGMTEKGMPSNIALIVNCQDDNATNEYYYGLYFSVRCKQ
jgi:hypothetical protein